MTESTTASNSVPPPVEKILSVGFAENIEGSSNGTGGVSENVLSASVTVLFGGLIVLKTFLASRDERSSIVTPADDVVAVDTTCA